LIHHQFDGDGADLWSLLAPPGERVRVNGQELLAGVRVLRDRDEVVLGREEPVYFSTQTLAVARPFEGAPHPIYCPRCQGLVEAGQMVVCCPGCHTVYHQFPERACWTYADKCCHCRRGTALEGGYDWTPEGI
jgi:hypothetical protein